MKSLLKIIFPLLIIGTTSKDNVELNSYLASSNVNESITPMLTDTVPSFPFKKTEAEWKEILTPSQYRILRKTGKGLCIIEKLRSSNQIIEASNCQS